MKNVFRYQTRSLLTPITPIPGNYRPFPQNEERMRITCEIPMALNSLILVFVSSLVQFSKVAIKKTHQTTHAILT